MQIALAMWPANPTSSMDAEQSPFRPSYWEWRLAAYAGILLLILTAAWAFGQMVYAWCLVRWGAVIANATIGLIALSAAFILAVFYGRLSVLKRPFSLRGALK